MRLAPLASERADSSSLGTGRYALQGYDLALGAAELINTGRLGLQITAGIGSTSINAKQWLAIVARGLHRIDRDTSLSDLIDHIVRISALREHAHLNDVLLFWLSTGNHLW